MNILHHHLVTLFYGNKLGIMIECVLGTKNAANGFNWEHV